MDPLSRRDFVARLTQLGIAVSILPATASAAEQTFSFPDPAYKFPGPWSFNLPKGSIILVSDQQLEDLQDPDREVNLSINTTPNITTLRRVCEETRRRGAKTLILAFDHFWAQYRAGQGEKPREMMPDTEVYLQKITRIGETLKLFGLGLELSLLSPLELGPGYLKKTGEQGRWVQFREGLRDPKTGHYEVQLWQHQRWTNNKGSIDVRRTGVRIFAFREQRLGGTPYYVVNPADIRELRQPVQLWEWPGLNANQGQSFAAQRLTVSGEGDADAGPLDRVLVVLSYATPELDYFSPRALPFLKQLVAGYHQAGVPLNGLYSDEMHIQQDWVYHAHHDEGQFTLRYLTPNLAKTFAEQYGSQYADLEKYLVYFCYGQHGFLANLDTRLAAQHVLGGSPDEISQTFLMRRRYYDLLGRTVVGLFRDAKLHAEKLYGHELEARAHATWAQSPTIDSWNTGPGPHAPKQYEYTSNFLWSNTIHQAAAACDDYFLWNEFLTGGGNDHTEGGWLDRNYYALALACSTGILNRTPYAYAAHWGMPAAVAERRQALVDAFGAAASPSFQAIANSQHRDVEVLMLYPLSLTAWEERFGSWMTQYGYANYVTPQVLLARAQLGADGKILMAGRTFTTLVVLFEPLPPSGLIPFLEKFVQQGGRLLWSGPPPRLDMEGTKVMAPWQKLFGIKQLAFGRQGFPAPGEVIQFAGPLKTVAPQTILTDFLVDHLYPVEPEVGAEIVASSQGRILGTLRQAAQGGKAIYLGFRPRDDQAASLGYETRTWFEILKALGAYPPSASGLANHDHPCVISRESPYLANPFPNGVIALAVHYRHHVETWPGGFHRDAKQDQTFLEKNPLPADKIEVKDFCVCGHRIAYQGRLLVAFKLDQDKHLVAFGGYQAQKITINDRDYIFADRPMAHIAWAPVASERRIPGGAILELWLHGEALTRIPLPSPALAADSLRLFASGRRPGSLGAEIPFTVENQQLVINAQPGKAQGHLLLLEVQKKT